MDKINFPKYNQIDYKIISYSPKTNLMSGAYICINVSSYNDFEDTLGIAHLIEHLLFQEEFNKKIYEKYFALIKSMFL